MAYEEVVCLEDGSLCCRTETGEVSAIRGVQDGLEELFLALGVVSTGWNIWRRQKCLWGD